MTITEFLENIVAGGNKVADPVTSWGDEVVDIHDSLLEVLWDNGHDNVESKGNEDHQKLYDLLNDSRVTSHGALKTRGRSIDWDTEASIKVDWHIVK